MKISLITVSYNSQETIRDTFESVRLQTIEGFDLEYIHIDGLSSDRTMEISKEYNDIVSIRVSEADSGIYNAMNKGVAQATGDVIGFLNSDDTFACHNALQLVAMLFTADDSLGVVYGDINYVDGNGEVKRKWRTGKRGSFAKGWHPAHPGFYAKKLLFDTHGGFDEGLFIAADFDLMLRFLDVARAGSSYLDEVLVDMKLGGESNRSLKNIRIGNEQIMQSFKKYSIQPQIFYTYRRWVRKVLQSIK